MLFESTCISDSILYLIRTVTTGHIYPIYIITNIESLTSTHSYKLYA